MQGNVTDRIYLSRHQVMARFQVGIVENSFHMSHGCNRIEGKTETQMENPSIT